MSPRSISITALAMLAGLLSLVAASLFAGLAIEGYSHLRHPLAMLGALQAPHGRVFGLFAFVGPGLAGAWVALVLRGRLPPAAALPARIGAQLILLAALAFAAQGLLPLDLESLDSGRSGYHATAWLLWALAFPLGALLLAAGTRRFADWRALALVGVVAALLLVACGFLASGWIGAAIAQRLACAAWLGWNLHAAVVAGRVVPASA